MRSYGDPSGVARALDLIGERWALLVVRELLLGPKRFVELSRGMSAMSENVLSLRLQELERNGVLSRVGDARKPGARGYRLTERGRALAPVLIELDRWGAAGADSSSAQGQLSIDALLLALRSRFRPDAASGLLAWVQLQVDSAPYQLSIADDGLTIERGTLEDPDATLATEASTLHELTLQGRALSDAILVGAATVTGSRRTAARVLACFHPASTQE